MKFITTALFLSTISNFSWAITGEEVLTKMDRNNQYQTIVSTARMEIHVDGQVRSKTMEIKGKSEGRKSLVTFTNPEDNGTKYLKLGDNLWIFFPSENDVVKISGHMLKEGMMGSDVSYEDALEADLLSKKYTITMSGSETLDGRECWVVQLEAKTKDAPYHKRTMWVDKETFVGWKEQMYAKSGRMLKESRILEVKHLDGRHVPVKMEMENKLRRNSKTVFITESIDYSQSLPDDLFTMRSLRR